MKYLKYLPEFENKNKERGVSMKINSKILGSVVTIVLVIGGVFVFNYNDTNKTQINDLPSGTSPVKTEKLAAIGVIEKINSSGENNEIILKIVDGKKDIDINVNLSTNIFKKDEDELLEMKDLSKGQKIEVYYDATYEFYDGITNSDGQISALRIEIIN